MNDATQPGRSRRRSTIIPSASRPRAGARLVSMALALLVQGPADAQAPDRPTIAIAAAITAEPATQISFPIRIGPVSSIPRNSFVRVRGLPQMASLSEGHSIGPGSWAIPLGALPDLKITIPVSGAGKTDVYVTLVAVDGTVLVEVKTMLIVAPPTSARAPTEAPATAAPMAILGPEARPQPPPAAPPVMQPEDREPALKLLKKGDEQLADGRVGPARLLYERAADMGLAQAAMALAATYDTAELTRPNLRGVRPDANEAKRWYERARQLGAREAEARLLRLGAN